MKIRSPRTSIACLLFVALGAVTAAAWTQEATMEQPRPQPGERKGLPDLVGGLRATPGCLGVETARASTGKNVIFAWFKDKEAVKGWYYSEMHQGAVDALVAGDQYARTTPLEHVDDDAGPILVIASITPAERPAFPDIHIPISQIAIELYEAPPGGAFVGGRFAPKEARVEHMRDYTPPSAVSDPSN
ncbi:MAG: antibiotic biosynthesis monooxygenase [Planctomycetota bacterium]|jgi:hypothetical protein